MEFAHTLITDNLTNTCGCASPICWDTFGFSKNCMMPKACKVASSSNPCMCDKPQAFEYQDFLPGALRDIQTRKKMLPHQAYVVNFTARRSSTTYGWHGISWSTHNMKACHVPRQRSPSQGHVLSVQFRSPRRSSRQQDLAIAGCGGDGNATSFKGGNASVLPKPWKRKQDAADEPECSHVKHSCEAK